MYLKRYNNCAHSKIVRYICIICLARNSFREVDRRATLKELMKKKDEVSHLT